MIVERRVVVLRIFRWMNGGTDEDRSTCFHQKRAEVMEFVLLEAIKDEIEIVHEQHRASSSLGSECKQSLLGILGNQIIRGSIFSNPLHFIVDPVDEIL